MPTPDMCITSSPCWLYTSERERTVPMSGRLVEARVSSTVDLRRRVSPGRTGFTQRTSSTPGDPRLAASSR
jgi:hypothetical protein